MPPSSSRKKALITGITGQDGSYLAEFLLAKGYDVHGIVRRSSSFNTDRIEHLYRDPHDPSARLFLHYGDLVDGTGLREILTRVKPDEVYNLGAQSHVRVSFDQPVYTVQADALGTMNLLEAIRDTGLPVRFYQASSSEMYGKVVETPQRETTPFYPRSPYACAKLYSHWQTVNYRESYGMFACSGILFNHESPRRGETFVTRKITRAATRIKVGLQEKLFLGNLDAKRDWGFAGDYCIGMDVPILTPQGWKFCDDVREGDEVINFDAVRNRLARDRVLAKVRPPHGSGERIILRGRGVYLCVTPEHRIYYQQKSRATKNWSDWRVRTAREFWEHFLTLTPRTRFDYRLPHFQDYDAPDCPGFTDDQLYLLGVLAAEGCLHRSDEGRGTVISVSQSLVANEPASKRIGLVLERLGIHFRARVRNDGVCEWRFSAADSRRVLDWFEEPNVHVLPRRIYDLSARQAQILFDALMDCDGHRGSMCYISKRSLLAADFQTIAHLAGYRTSQVAQRSDGTYVVQVIARRKKHAYVEQVERRSDEPDAVWCVRTNNGTIVTRDSGCISISGNCEAMWLMLQQEQPDDYVVATGQTHSVREFLDEVFGRLELDWHKHVEIDARYFRPAEVDLLLGDATKAREKLGWRPKVTFKELARMMTDADLKLAKREKLVRDGEAAIP